MRKAIPVLLLSAAFVAVLLGGCDKVVSEESTTDINEKIIETIDKSSPITQGNLITKTNTDTDGNVSIEYYDSVGNLVESYKWNKDDVILSHSVITYDVNNNVQKKEEIGADGSSTSVESYHYDSNGNVSSTTLNEFDDGKLSKSTSFDSEGNVTGYSLSEYDENDYLIKIERYDNNDQLCEYYTYEYNDLGQTTKYSAFDSDNNLLRYTIFEFNDKGLPVKEKYYNGNNELESYYSFTYYEDGTMASSTSYDAQGNLLSEDFFEKTN